VALLWDYAPEELYGAFQPTEPERPPKEPHDVRVHYWSPLTTPERRHGTSYIRAYTINAVQGFVVTRYNTA
jgi:hypothetical protein